MSAQLLYPLRFQEIVKRALWGGRRLATVLGKPLGPEEDYAESWEVCDLESDQSVVAHGPLAGRTLHELVCKLPAELLGRHAGAERFPLLVKFIDACRTLSVQVHPNDEQAVRMGLGANGKTEAWVILEAEPASILHAGLKRGVDRDALEQALAGGTVAQCLHDVPVQRGDCVFLPAGTVHAIGAGILLTEIQQPSDVTFRLFDWNRLDAEGKPRQLHVEDALKVIDFGRGPVEPVQARSEPDRRDGWDQVQRLVDCEQFVLRRRSGAQEASLGGGNEFHVVVCIEGEVVLDHGEHRYPLGRGDTILLPAVLGPVVCRPTGPATLLDVTLP